MGKIRTTSILLVFLFNVVAMTLVGNGYADEQGWEYYSHNKEFQAYFHPKSIQCLSDGEVKVLEKMVLTKKSVELLVELAKKYDKEKVKKYKKAHSEIMQTGLNCDDRLYIIYRDIIYDKEGSVLNINDYDNPVWNTVIPGTFKDGLLELMCGYCNNRR